MLEFEVYVKVGVLTENKISKRVKTEINNLKQITIPINHPKRNSNRSRKRLNGKTAIILTTSNRLKTRPFKKIILIRSYINQRPRIKNKTNQQSSIKIRTIIILYSKTIRIAIKIKVPQQAV